MKVRPEPKKQAGRGSIICAGGRRYSVSAGLPETWPLHSWPLYPTFTFQSAYRSLVKNSAIIRLVLFGALVIVSIIGFQSYWVMNTWNVQEQQFHDRVTKGLLDVTDDFRSLGRELPEYDLIKRMSSNYYVVNLNDEINANNLQYFLRKRFEAEGIKEDFEYGIYDCATNQMVYGDYVSQEAIIDSTNIQKETLPVYDKYIYYFGVRFPNWRSEVLSNMGITVVSSVILLVTILFFVYAMYIILRQKRLSEMQKDFINNMTHEFKTPISTIKISADVFLNDKAIRSSTRLRQYAGIIKEQNQRLNDQVEKVLQIAKIERDNFKLTKERTDLHRLLEGVLSATSLQVEELGGTLHRSFRATAPCVSADRLHLTNVLHNLLDNAIKYSADTPQIRVATRDDPKGIRLVIEDRGIGIPAEVQDKVFDKFYRVNTGNVHDVKGFGLGLFYVKNVCDGHGWPLRLESAPGEGTRVEVLLR